MNAASHDENGQPIDGHSLRQSIRVEKYFRAMMKAGASDLHIKAGMAPHVRINSMIRPTSSKPLTNADIEAMVTELLTEKQQAYFAEHGSIDIAHELEGSDRFRLNIFRQRGQISISVRRVTREILDFQSLHLPASIARLAEEHQGLVLLSGPTGSGKSTTIAAMIEHINSTRACHIVTIEDPIEFIYDDKMALISQREIGIDVENFAAALKYLMREDPDVVLIGEMRDEETFQAALQASETGHLVFGTVHASSAPQTIERILALFPPDSRDLIRQSLAFNLKAIICQRLLPTIREDVKRIPAVEVMITNPSIRQLIEQGRDNDMLDVIRSNERDGMQSFTRSLIDLIEKEFIEPKVAYEVAPNVDELKMMLKGISSGRSGLIGR